MFYLITYCEELEARSNRNLFLGLFWEGACFSEIASTIACAEPGKDFSVRYKIIIAIETIKEHIPPESIKTWNNSK
jgi:hypothetical protein